jgi:rare lipoprotein A
VHRDSDYTRGGLYAPEVSDGRPSSAPDISNLPEPVPRAEPRSRYGNRSPYTVLGRSYRVLDSAQGYHERGVASWYGTKFNGRATSSGELYDICSFTAAHKTLPLPSYVRVTNLDNGRQLIVRVNDRGPFHEGRIMDLSYAAAIRLGVDRTGTARVEIEAVGPGDRPSPKPPYTPISSEELQPALSEDADISPPADADPPARLAMSGAQWVQVGSFGEKDNARRLADRLRDAGVDDVDMDHVEADGRDLWRVRIGPVDGQDLDALLARLRELGLSRPRVFSQ